MVEFVDSGICGVAWVEIEELESLGVEGKRLGERVFGSVGVLVRSFSARLTGWGMLRLL